MKRRARLWVVVALVACTDQLATVDGGNDAATNDVTVADTGAGDAAADAINDVQQQNDASTDAPVEAAPPIIPCTGSPSVLVTDPGTLFGVAVDDQNIYWANESTNKIMAQPLAGDASVTLAKNLILPTDVTVDSNYVYFADSTAGNIVRLYKDGGVPTKSNLGDGTGAYGLSAQGSLLFVSYHGGGVNSGVGTMPIGGGAYSQLTTGGIPAGAGTDTNGGYYVDGQSGSVKYVLFDGGGPFLIAPGQADPYDVASDGKNVYWTNLNATKISEGPMDGGPAYTFTNIPAAARGIWVDAYCVYWSLGDGSGKIYTMSK